MASPRRILPYGNYTFGCANCSGVCFFDGVCAPPPLNHNSTDGGDSIPIQLHQPSHLVPNLLISASSILVAAFIVLLATYAVHRYRRSRRLPSAAGPPSPTGGDEDDLFEEGEADHHVWHIRTVGLDDATIRSITACFYKADDGLLGGAADCTVCLAEFRDGELLRLLPKCGHAFHLSCVDTWLRSHVNCPLCRAPILSAAAAADPENPAPSSSSPPLDVSIDPVGLVSGSSAIAENSQIDIGQSESDQVVSEQEKEGGLVEVGIGVNLTAASSSLLLSSELPSNFGEDGFQPVRRSVSLDSLSLAALLHPEEKSGDESREPKTGEDRVVKNKGKRANAAKGAPLRKGSIEMGRSLSSRSGRFFLSRNGRARNSVLPL